MFTSEYRIIIISGFGYDTIKREVLRMKAFIHTDWWDVLKPEFEKPYYHQLHEFLKNEYRTKNIH
ncbi:MAG: uracil-DNA glycosylase, partial [Lactiplantibacillus plantarum]|nr:uracil-DNA glycosylase [Lactiplantibacillus plantarum]